MGKRLAPGHRRPSSRGRTAGLALAAIILTISACGGRASGGNPSTASGGGSSLNSGASTGTAAGSSSGETSNGGSDTGSASASGSPLGSGATTGFASGSSAGMTGRSSGSGSSDAGMLAPSCQPGGPGMTDCGANKESCCTSLEVTGGTYYRTYDLSDAGVPLQPDGGGATGEADPATVSTFKLDKYLTTVGRFRQFVNTRNGGWVPTAGSGKHAHLNGGQGLANSASPGTYEPGWIAVDDSNIAPTNADLTCNPNYATWTASAGTQENLPINCVNWYEAYAFCIWDGGFLPSEAEWECAAAGGSQQREYPWGWTDPGTSNEYAIYAGRLGICHYPDGGTCTGTANIAPVGTAELGAGLWGQLDLAGEVFELTLDWYAPYVGPCANCAFLMATSGRVVRGGYLLLDPSLLLPAFRSSDPPKVRDRLTGFRCARAS
jgi:formylglycine-generating enzyme